jgi:archaellin
MLGVGAVMVRIGVPLIQRCRRTAHQRESSVSSEIWVVDVTAKWNVKNETSFTI